MNLYLLLLIFSIITTTVAQWNPWEDARRFQDNLNDHTRARQTSSITWMCMDTFKYKACNGKLQDCEYFAQVLIGLGPIGTVTAARGDAEAHQAHPFPYTIYQAHYGARKLEFTLIYSPLSGVQIKRAEELIC